MTWISDGSLVRAISQVGAFGSLPRVSEIEMARGAGAKVICFASSESMMAEQNVGLVNRIQPLREIVHELVKDAQEELESIQRRL